jgi:hypothetical protein
MGAAIMVQGVGAALSTTYAGAIIVWGGYANAMLVLTGIAVVALALLVVAVPETAPAAGGPPRPSLDPPAGPAPERTS